MRWAQSLESLLAMGFSQFLPALLPNLEAEMLLLDQIDGNVPRKLNTVRVLGPGSSNQHESLSGIETKNTEGKDGKTTRVPINMNPYQGLKHQTSRRTGEV